eukprot:2613150-Pyramimonas_sp.AAC.1
MVGDPPGDTAAVVWHAQTATHGTNYNDDDYNMLRIQVCTSEAKARLLMTVAIRRLTLSEHEDRLTNSEESEVKARLKNKSICFIQAAVQAILQEGDAG